MSTVRSNHDRAMELSQLALAARLRGDTVTATELAAEALVFERRAADMVPDTDRAEPTRSILYRSAASLALQAGQLSESRRLVGMGLSGRPSPAVVKELEDILLEIRTITYLENESQSILEHTLSMRLDGDSVRNGTISFAQLSDRVDGLNSLVRRMVEYLEGIPFVRIGPPRAAARRIVPVLSGVEGGSFIARFAFRTTTLQTSLFTPPEQVIANVVRGINLAQDDDSQRLREFLGNEEERVKHFRATVRKIAPDGQQISEVDFVYMGGATRIRKTKDAFVEPLPEKDAVAEAQRLEVIGWIDTAKKADSQVMIVPFDKALQPITMDVSEGLNDLVIDYWNAPGVRVVYDDHGRFRTLVTMDPVES